MSLRDLEPVARLRRSQAYLFDSITPASDPKRILFYTMDTWQLGLIEQFLHLAFQLKGHDPKTVYFDGLLPICGWENHEVTPPPAETLIRRARHIFDSLQIPAQPISAYLDAAVCRRNAELSVDKIAPETWPSLSYLGIAIGRIALRDLFQYTMGHFEPRNKTDIAEFRRHLIHAVMSVDLANAILDRERPDVVVLVNGKLVMYSYMYEVARARNVEVTTWEEGMYFDTSVVFANNAKAIDFPVESKTRDAYMRAPAPFQALTAVESYFKKWRNQSATWYKYYTDEIRDISRIRRELSLPAQGRLVSIFTNIIWDTNALEKDDAFDGMMDWVFDSIDRVGAIPGATLIVRAHPGELRCQFKTRTPVRQMIVDHYGGLPSHIRVVDGPSELSSYEIAIHSDVCAVYTSTLGIELSLMGLQPLICGVPFYSRHGFTNDVRSKNSYGEFLEGRTQPCEADPEQLKRFMYMIIFKLVKRPEFFVGIHDTPQIPIVRIDTFEGFPESMPQFNEIVESILDRRSFVRLDESPETPQADLVESLA